MMARKAKTISVPQEDFPVLEAMKANPDESIALPAKIILALQNNPNIKNVSKILGISEPTIYKWRDRYLEAGIDGLYTRKRTPKTSSLTKDSVSALIGNSDPEKSWTAKEIAEHLGITQRQAHNAMKKLDIPSERCHSWTYQTSESAAYTNPYIVGLYLSYDIKVIIFSTLTERDLCGWTLRGRMITYSRSLKKYMDTSATELSMLDTLITATEMADTAVKTTGTGADTFIETVVEEWQEVSDATLHIYTCADKPPAYHGTRLRGLIFGHFSDCDEWLQKVKGFNWHTDPRQLFEAATTANAIEGFLHHCRKESSTYIWYLLYSQSGRETASESSPDEFPVLTDKNGTFEEELSSFLTNTGMEPEKQECVAILVSRDEDSKLVYSVTKPTTGFPATSTFDLTTEEGFERSINSLDQCATALGDSIDKDARRFYLDVVKKKARGVLTILPVECCKSRMEVLVPLSLIPHIGLRNGRYLSAEYRRTAGKLIVNDSFRTACDTFNDIYRKKVSGSELPLSTFEQDILDDGLRLIIAKNKEADAVLTRFGICLQTGHHQSGILPEEIKNVPPDWCEVTPASNAMNLVDARRRLLMELDGTFDLNSPGLEIPGDLTEFNEYHESIDDEDMEGDEKSPIKPSEPDRDATVRITRKRRQKRYQPCSDPFEVDAIANGYWKWYNEAVKEESCRILHNWKLEKDVKQNLYIAIDAVFVNEQTDSHVKGGRTEFPDKKPKVGLWNIKVEWETGSYIITDPDLLNAIKQLMAFVLDNSLNKRHFIFFTDGEDCIFKMIKSFFGEWYYTIYLDYLHARNKIFDRLSSALAARREPDPRREPELYKIGPKKGQVKSQAMISVSRLFARRASSILWAGNVDELIQYLQNIPEEYVQKQFELDKLIGYFRNKRPYITCYALRRRLGLRNSSCFVEGINNTLVSARQKDNGMSFRVLGSSVLASYTALFQNGEDSEWFKESVFTFSQTSHKTSDTKGSICCGTKVSQFHWITDEERTKYGPRKTYQHDD